MNLDTPEDAFALKIALKSTEPIGAQIHQLLRMSIIEGRLLPGQSMSETEIAARFLTSRQPVREAFIKLAEERLIEILPQRGTRVRKISVSEVNQARHLREIIEVSIVRELVGKLAKNADENLINTLREIIDAQSKIAIGDGSAFLILDEQFHQALAFAANRQYMWRITETIKAQMNRVRFLSFDLVTPIPELLEEHSAIVDALEFQNAKKAEQAMQKHLRGLLSSLPQIAELFPDYFEA